MGAIAFFQNLTKDISVSNKEKWKGLSEIIKVVDFDNLCFDIVARNIRSETLGKLENLIYAIRRRDLDIIDFKSLYGNKIQKKLLNLNLLHQKFKGLVHDPYWKLYDDKNGDESLQFGYRFNKQSFYRKAFETKEEKDFKEADNEYVKHLESLEIIVEEMKKTFYEIQKLANKDSFEFILPWKWFK